MTMSVPSARVNWRRRSIFSYTKNRGLLLSWLPVWRLSRAELAPASPTVSAFMTGLTLEPRPSASDPGDPRRGMNDRGREKYRAAPASSPGPPWTGKKRAGGWFSQRLHLPGRIWPWKGWLEYYYWEKDPEVLAGIQSAADKGIYHFWDPERGYLQNEGGSHLPRRLSAWLYRENRGGSLPRSG